MSTTKHETSSPDRPWTPGPLHARHDSVNDIYELLSDTQHVADVYCDLAAPAESRAIVNLFLAAPEMFEALKAHEEWEAQFILDGDWNMPDGGVAISPEQLEALNEVQRRRNAAMATALGEAS